MISQENRSWILSVVVSALVILLLATYTDLKTLVRLPTAIIAGIIVLRISESVGQ